MAKGGEGSRLGRLRESMEEEKLDGVLMVPGPNLRYFTGVESLLLERPFMLLVPMDGSPSLVAPALEAGPYRECKMPMAIHSWTDSQGSAGAIRAAVRAVRPRGRWGVEGKVPFLFLSRLMKATAPKFLDGEPLLQGLRAVKDEGEVKLLKRSAKILGGSFEKFPELLRDGATEVEVAKAATEVIYGEGATMVDAMLVQSGARGADPHSLPSSKKIRRGEGVIFDVGSTFEGYYADITRTICLGAAKEVEKVYAKVLEAEVKGIAASGAGVKVGEVDGASRGVLRRAGLGRYFIHRTGHGLGLEVHEAPYIVEGGKEVLRRNMCFTVEPGVYIRGKLGVRIEDDVLIGKGRGVEITGTPKEFGWWK
ncbi:MAG: aminopeptidase P family protein [Thaumarchaeota archaeon]|nr:aminopeptidase P family protein [Nitrososphaerota archaeon]